MNKSVVLVKLSFNPNCQYKPNKKYIRGKISHLLRMDKSLLKCDCFDGSILGGVWEMIIFSFGLSKALGFKIFQEPETKRSKKNKNI